MMYFLDNASRSNAMVFVIVILLLFIAITFVYIIHLQIQSNNQYKVKTNMNPSVPLYKDEANKQMVEESFDLQSVTRELETLPRERTIDMTPYEEEQEQKAIISYDELVNQNYKEHISYSDTIHSDNILVKQVDLENTGKIKLEKEDNNLINYEHEEEFLKQLKELNKLLN